MTKSKSELKAEIMTKLLAAEVRSARAEGCEFGAALSKSKVWQAADYAEWIIAGAST